MNRFALMFLIVLFLAVYFLPRPFSFLANDEFVYILSAIRLVDNHTLFYTNELMEKYEDPAFSPTWYVPISDTNSISKYYHGFPFILALFYILGGKGTIFYANAVLGIVGLFIAYKLGELLFDKKTGLITIILLGFNPIYLKMVYSNFNHIAALVFILISFFFWFKSHKKNDNLLGILSGICLGYAILIHITSALLIVAFLIGWMIEKKLKIKSFLLGLLPVLVFIAAFNFIIFGSPIKTGYSIIGEDAQFNVSYVLQNMQFYISDMTTYINILLVLSLFGFIYIKKHLRIFFAISIFCFLAFLFSYYYNFRGWLSMRFLLPIVPLLSLLAANFLEKFWKNHKFFVILIILSMTIINVANALPQLKASMETMQLAKIKWECFANLTSSNSTILASVVDGGKSVFLANRIAYDYYRTTPYELVNNINDMLKSREVYFLDLSAIDRGALDRHSFVFTFPNNDDVIRSTYKLKPTTCYDIYNISGKKIVTSIDFNITKETYDKIDNIAQ